MSGDQQYERIKAAFLAASELTPNSRDRLLVESFGEDMHSRNRVLHLLSLAALEEEQSSDEDARILPEFELLLDRFRIEAPLAHGGHGNVYLAADMRVPGRKVVVKVLDPGIASDWVAAKFREEARSLARIAHPGVVQVIDSGETQHNILFLVMCYVPGETLRARLAKGPAMTVTEVAALLKKLAAALSAIHAAGVIHRDLKPENVILRPDGQPVIVDLGIASLLEAGQDELITPPAGSHSYLAPEARLGRPSRQSDIFSLAVVAAEMLHAVPLDAPTRRILAKGMAANETERYASPTQFARHLSASLLPTRRSRVLLVLPLFLILIAAIVWIIRQPHAATSSGTPVAPGNLLVPVVKSTEIVEFDSRRRLVLRGFALPQAFTLDHTVPTVLVRPADSAILINARDSEARPVILQFSASGAFEYAHPLPGMFAEPLIPDPADRSGNTVLTSLISRPRIIAVDTQRRRTSVRLELGWGKYLGLTVDSKGNLYAADFLSGKVRRFSVSGHDEGVVAQAEGNSVSALAIDDAGNLYAAEARLRRILKFAPDGRILLRLQSPLMQAPHAVYFNPADHLLYVGDWGSPDLLVFTTQGEFVYAAEMTGRGPSIPGLVPFRRAP